MFEQISPQTALLVAFLAAFPPTLVAFLSSRRARRAVHEVHLELNSRLTELLELTAREAGQEGERRGRQDAHDMGTDRED